MNQGASSVISSSFALRSTGWQLTMPRVEYPTEVVLGTYDIQPNKENPDSVFLNIYATVHDKEDRNKVAWDLEPRVWKQEKHCFETVGTSEATVVVENGFLIVTNRDGQKASLRLPKHIKQDGPVLSLHPDHLKVELPKAAAVSA